MASAQTLSAADAVVKELYDGQKVENLVYDGAPLLAMIKKSTDFYGDVKPIPLQYGNPQGISPTFSQAQTNVTASKYARFQLTRKKLYAYATIDGEAIVATSNDKGGFVKLFEREIDSALAQLGREWHNLLYGNAGGAYGQVATGGITTTSLTLANTADVVHFEVGMELGASTDDGTGSGTDRVGTATVTAIDRDTGVLTTDSDWTSQITSLAAGDYLFRQGYQGAVMAGLAAWVPSTAPTSTAFFGLDRTTDKTRLGGVRYDGSSVSIEEALQIGAARLARQGKLAKATHCFMHVDRFSDLCISLGSKVQYIDHKVGELGFQGVKIPGGGGGWIEVFPDYACPSNKAYLLKLDTWEWNGLEESPHIIMQDGLRALRQPSDDGVEVRFRIMGNLSCNAPGYNCVITLPT